MTRMHRALVIGFLVLIPVHASALPAGPRGTAWTDHNASDPGISLIRPTRHRR